MSITLGVLTVIVVSVLYRLFRAYKAVSGLPILLCAFSPFSAFGLVLPWNSWNPGVIFNWERRHDLYKGCDTIGILALFPDSAPVVYTSSPEVVRQFGSLNSAFQKNWQTNAGFSHWGKNLFTSSGDDWKRHKRIVAPALNASTYSLVWEETARCFYNLTSSDLWRDRGSVEISSAGEITSKVALFALSAAAFGIRLDWDEPPVPADGRLSIEESLRAVGENLALKLILPNWMFSLPIPRLRKVGAANSTLKAYMRERVAARKLDLSGRDPNDEKLPQDVFSRLVAASENEGKGALNDEELVGNTFLMLLAGHDTTANVLAAAFGLLAYHQTEQEMVYQHITKVLEGREPTIGDFDSLTLVVATFLESLRIFPIAQIMMRDTREDTIIKVLDKASGRQRDQLIRKGTLMLVDLVGINYDPNRYPDPGEFRPTRWESQPERNAFLGFSTGPRQCVGNKFSTVEGVCFLTLLLQHYKLNPLLKDGETKEQWKDRVFRAKFKGVMTPSDIPIVLTKRE